ncbi:MAG: hypothetical protein PHI60_06950, partial [Candidatus Omnitrophica bacterium]|nr:hypothetical protein [Candidatus Omnitrophota bacterium]
MSIKSVFLAAAVFILSLGVKPAYSYKVGDVDIRLKAIISEQYDDNVTYASSNEKDDFVNIAGFGLLAKGEGKMQQLDLGGNVIWHTYNENENFNYTSENLFLNYRREYSKFDTVRLKDSFIHSEEPASFEDEFGRTTGRYTFIKNWFNSSYTKELTENFSSTFSYFNNAAAFSSSGPSDSFLNGTSIQGHYLLNAKNIINLIYRFESRSYDTGGHVRVNSYTGGIKHFLTERLYAHGSIGQDHVKSTLSSDNGLHLSAGITDELNENTTLGIL